MAGRAPRIVVGIATLALASVPVAGCGDEKSSPKAETTQAAGGRVATPLPEAMNKEDTKPADPKAGTEVPLVPRLSALSASAEQKVSSIDVRPDAERLTTEQPDVTPPAGAEVEYRQFVKAVLPLINNFWKAKVKRFAPGARYRRPGYVTEYNGADGPGCAGKRSPDMIGNAYYCPSVLPVDLCTTVSANRGYCEGEDIIAWDSSGLLLPYYQRIGTLAAALVLAHEWGHLVQSRVYPRFGYTTVIRRELQADCYAGAWALAMERQGRVDIGAFNQTLELFQSIGGSGDAWLDPTSHGNQFQRIRSFTQGFDNDARGCIGRPFDTMLKRVGLGAEK